MTRRLPLPSVSSWATLIGVGAAAVGLAWDIMLHARDPLLAAHEGVLTTSNPAHVLLGSGLALAFLGQTCALALALAGVARRVLAAVLAVLAIGTASAIGWTQFESAKQAAAAQQLVAETSTGIPQYRNVNAAIQAGYQPMTPLNWPVVEWVNPTFTQAGRVLDVRRPERLMYVSAPGGLMLAGAMFVLPDGAATPGGIAGAHWHRHQDLCYLATGAIAGTNGYGAPCPPGSAARATRLMLHVWIVPNPSGPFADDLTPAGVAALSMHA